MRGKIAWDLVACSLGLAQVGRLFLYRHWGLVSGQLWHIYWACVKDGEAWRAVVLWGREESDAT